MSEGTIDFSSLITFLLVTIPAVYKLVQPLIKQSIKTQTNAGLKERLQIMDNLASDAVAEMSNMANLSKADRKKEAVRYVLETMSARDLEDPVNENVIPDKVEKAYQEYKHSVAGDVHLPEAVEEVGAD